MRRLALVILPVLIAGAIPHAGAQEEGPRADREKALDWLVSHQGANGSFGKSNQLALTGMAGLALLSSGSTPREGRYAENVRRAIRWCLAQQQPQGGAFVHASSGYSAIHNHGYVLTFLAQAYGMMGSESEALTERVALAIRRGIEATVNSQHANGGYGYFLFNRPPANTEMMTQDEASTTISQIQALRAARNAGFAVPPDVIGEALAYMEKCRHADTGGFIYSLTLGRVSAIDGRNVPTFAITAASLCVLHGLGRYEGELLDKGLAYLLKFRPPSDDVHFYYYGHYYAAQVLYQVGSPAAAQWREAVLADLAHRQRPDGSFGGDDEWGLEDLDAALLHTAWATQILHVDSGYLPLFQR